LAPRSGDLYASGWLQAAVAVRSLIFWRKPLQYLSPDPWLPHC